MSSFIPSVVQRNEVKPEVPNTGNKGNYILDNRDYSIVQKKIKSLNGISLQNGTKHYRNSRIIQCEPTEAEKFAMENRDRVEDKNMALIGSDNKYKSDVAERLKAAAKDHPLPSYLSKYLVDEAGDNEPEWTQEKNELWMDKQTEEKRNFILKHPAIEKILNENPDTKWFRDNWYKRELQIFNKKNKGSKNKPPLPSKESAMTGTWREVEKLLLSGKYNWDNKVGIFFHNDTTEDIKLQAIQEELDIMARQNSGNGMAAAADINHK